MGYTVMEQSFPGSYVRDTEGKGDLGRRVMAFGEAAAEAEATRRVWEEVFDEPYERAGAGIDPAASPSRVFLNWEAAEADVNRTYKGLHPRFLMEVKYHTFPVSSIRVIPFRGSIYGIPFSSYGPRFALFLFVVLFMRFPFSFPGKVMGLHL